MRCPRWSPKAPTVTAAAGCLALLAPAIAAADESPAVRDLADLSLEQLMDIEVTSVSKRPERLSEAAAAIHVITREDIRRSGLTSLPDVLRLAPGLNVAQSGSTPWAISSRGFNDVYATKLLVLIDGRSVYSPGFSGVFWDVQDVSLEDVERIEVIRGPGGTLWGANAVNGVINVTTRDSAETQGLAVAGRAGSQSFRQGVLRFGGAAGEDLTYRLFFKTTESDGLVDAEGDDIGDSWRQTRGGLRADWQASDADRIEFQTGFYRHKTHEHSLIPDLLTGVVPVTADEEDSGWHASAKWQRQLGPDSDLVVQAYYTRLTTEHQLTRLRDRTYDIEARHHFLWRGRHEIVWGGGYRLFEGRGATGPLLTIDADDPDLETANVFAQDEVTLTPTLRVVAGIKLEHNSVSGFEYEPNLRLVWTPAPERTVWASVSRAIRTPSVAQESIRANVAAIPGTPPQLVRVMGSPDPESETLVAFEVGYRAALTPNLTIDAAAFYNLYEKLATSRADAPFLELEPIPHIVLPYRYGNELAGHTYGGEVAATWQAAPNWRLSASYDLLVMETDPLPAGVIPAARNTDGSSPRRQARLQSRLNLTPNLEFDATAFHASKLPDLGIPAYTRIDLRLAWRASDRLEVGVVGQNLTNGRHQEFEPLFRPHAEVPRAFHIYFRSGF